MNYWGIELIIYRKKVLQINMWIADESDNATIIPVGSVHSQLHVWTRLNDDCLFTLVCMSAFDRSTNNPSLSLIEK